MKNENKLTIKEKKKRILEMLSNNLSNISKTCKQVGISRTTFYRWIETDEKFSNSIDEVKESCIDEVEDILINDLIRKKKDVTATIFFLKTRGKERGYTERTNIDLAVKESPFEELMKKHNL